MRDTTTYHIHLVTPWYQLKAWQTFPIVTPSLELLAERAESLKNLIRQIEKDDLGSVWRKGKSIFNPVNLPQMYWPPIDNGTLITDMLSRDYRPLFIPVSVRFADLYRHHLLRYENSKKWEQILMEIDRYKAERAKFGR